MDSVTPEREPITYRLTLGDDWYRIRLDESFETDVKAFLDVLFDGIPAEAADQTRSLITAQFATYIATARARRGIELLVPAPKSGGAAMPGAAILLAEVVIPSPVAPSPTDVATQVARNTVGARTGVIAGSAAVRIDHSFAGSGTNADTAPPRQKRIEYVIAVPHDPRWLSIDLSLQAVDGFDMAGTATKFDQLVTALNWC